MSALTQPEQTKYLSFAQANTNAALKKLLELNSTVQKNTDIVRR